MPRPTFEEIWRRRFIERGRVFDDDAGIAGWTDSGLEARLRHFQRVWPGDAPGAAWLDAGCGAGSYTRYLAERGVAPIGLDYSLPSVQKANARSDGAIPWLVGDATQLPVRPGSMDGVMCFGVLQALASPEKAIAELVKVVRPDGQIWIDALNGSCMPSLMRRCVAWLRGRPLSLRFDSAGHLKSLLHGHGATQVKVYWIPILPGRLKAFQSLVECRAFRYVMRLLGPASSLFSHAVLIQAKATNRPEA